MPVAAQPKVRFNEKAVSRAPEYDANAALLPDRPNSSHTATRSTEKASSKKKKRLESYIDKKLKQERRAELLNELQEYQKRVPDDVQLRTSSSIGSRQQLTALSKLQKKKQLQENKRQRVKSKLQSMKESDSEDEFQADAQDEERIHIRPLQNTIAPQIDDKVVQAPQVNASLGSGLKRASDGTLPVPIAVKRRKTAWGRLPVVNGELEDDSVTSFDSSDSAFDTDDSYSEEESLYSGSEEEGEWLGIPSDSDGEPTNSSHKTSPHTPGADEDQDPEHLDDSQTVSQRVRGSFTEWAQQQRDQMEHYQSNVPPVINASHPTMKTGQSSFGPLGERSTIPTDSLALLESKPTVISVDRPTHIQESRSQLPVLKEEDVIMHSIRHHPVTVLCGETGSGKTSQVPQFLYEAGFGHAGSDNPGMIGITQPRRVAAVSMAKRVKEELGLKETSSLVAHQIRYDTTTSSQTKIKFMTDGVLLRELASDFLLSRYSVIIVDEAHERSINTDILLGILSRVVRLREEMWKSKQDNVKVCLLDFLQVESSVDRQYQPLRFIIMSATLKLTDFLANKHLFPKKPELVNVTARQFPVTIHFSRRTSSNYSQEAYKKTCKIHSRLPPGGVLVFMTGQDEIQILCRKLTKRFSQSAISRRAATGTSFSKEVVEATDVKIDPRGRDVEPEEIDLGLDEGKDLATDVDDTYGLSIQEDVEALDTSDDEEETEFTLEAGDSTQPMHILPLYSLLSSDQQMRVFEPVPEGHRLVIVATNVAETSLTIPGIRYVVDCGRSKERQYDMSTGMQSFQVGWISKASAAQRAGRAGRTGPGHCYRLYSSPVYERYLADHTTPEILRVPIESMVLQMKSINIDVVINFPFPTPPDRAALQKAERKLIELGALAIHQSKSSKQAATSHITELGKAMSLFPLPPRFSKMLVTGQQHGCLPYVIALVCALSVGDPFLRDEGLGFSEEDLPNNEAFESAEIGNILDPEVKARELRKAARRRFYQSQAKFSQLGNGISDLFKLLGAVGAYEYEQGSSIFCQENFLRPKAMQEAHKLRAQIGRLVQSYYPKSLSSLELKLPPPTDMQLKVLRQLIAASYIDQVAIRKDLIDPSFVGRFVSCRDVAYHALNVREDVFIHPSSVLFDKAPPEFICFQELFKSNRAWLKVCTTISPHWLATLGTIFCSFSKVIETPANMLSNGRDAKERDVLVTPRLSDGSFELELKPVKMRQRREGHKWVFA